MSKTYDSKRGFVTALSGLSFTVQDGEFVSVVGPSGCGKSTLLMILAGLIPPSSGHVEVDGVVQSGTRGDVGVVFQQDLLLDWRSAIGNVLLHATLRKLPKGQAVADARELLRLVGLEGFEQAFPFELSGGMRQRVAIARALIHRPRWLFFDEPFGALDAFTREQLNDDLLRVWEDDRKTAMLVTHSIDEAVFLSDRVLVLNGRPGQLVMDLPITLERPRVPDVRTSSEFVELVHEVRRAFKGRAVEQQKG